jgi:hypothetical protein
VINRQKRDIAKRMVEGFAAGTVTSREMEDDFPWDKDDPALARIWEHLWLLWDDYHNHTLTGKHAPTPEARAMMDRCITFLDSNLEYEWPPYRGSLRLLFLRILRLHKRAAKVEERQTAELAKFGDLEVWPFLRKQDWQRATRSG